MAWHSIGEVLRCVRARCSPHLPIFRDATYFETQLKIVLDAEAEAFVKVSRLENRCLLGFLTLSQLMWRMLVFETLRQQL
jgi:hypothetical protein